MIGGGTAFAVGGVGTAAAREGRRQGASAENTIYEIVEASADFDTLVAALEETGLDAVLDGTDDQYTVFAPTDGAFSSVNTSNLSTEELTNVLLYHVTGAAVTAGRSLTRRRWRC